MSDQWASPERTWMRGIRIWKPGWRASGGKVCFTTVTQKPGAEVTCTCIKPIKPFNTGTNEAEAYIGYHLYFERNSCIELVQVIQVSIQVE